MLKKKPLKPLLHSEAVLAAKQASEAAQTSPLPSPYQVNDVTPDSLNRQQSTVMFYLLLLTVT